MRSMGAYAASTMTSDDHVTCPHCNRYFRISIAKMREALARLKMLILKEHKMKTAQVPLLKEEDYETITKADLSSTIEVLGQETVDGVFESCSTWKKRYEILGGLLLQADFDSEPLEMNYKRRYKWDRTK